MPAEIVACPLCSGDASLAYTGVQDLEYFMEASYDLYRCRECRLMFMHPLPTRAELPGLYPGHYHNFEPPKTPSSRVLLNGYYDHQCADARRHLPPDGSFLEIACAAGDILERMRRHGYEDVQSIELSLEACQRAWQRGLKEDHGTL